MTRYALPLFALTMSAPAWADATSIIQGVEARYSKVETIQGDFVQTAKSMYGDTKQTGKLALKRPTKMSWTFEDGKQFMSNGSKMWIYTPSEKQVMQYDDVSGSTAGADSLLQSLDKIGELFTVEVLEETATLKKVKLTPKKANDQVKHVELSLDGDLLLKSVTILDGFDGTTTMDFANVVLGASIDDASFEFKTPAGVEVIKAN